MWIDHDGVAHPVALPDPATLMFDEFRTCLDALVTRHRSEVKGVLEAAEGEIFNLDLSRVPGPDEDAEYQGVPAPRGLLHGPLHTVRDLGRALERTDLRWRLDAVVALDEYVD